MNNRRYWLYVVPSKEMENHFGGVEMGEIYVIQGTGDDIIYNLWGTKERICVMKMMDTGGRLLVDDTCKEAVKIWK